MAMLQVIDASIAISFFIDDKYSQTVRRDVFGAQPPADNVAPSLILLELQGVLSKRFAVGRVTMAQLINAPRILGSLVRFVPLELGTSFEAIKLSMFAMRLTAEGGDARPLPGNVYDCAYIATAFAENAELVTADQRQAAIAGSVGCKVRLIGS
jgi:predicted nucleic acid-binding protein